MDLSETDGKKSSLAAHSASSDRRLLKIAIGITVAVTVLLSLVLTLILQFWAESRWGDYTRCGIGYFFCSPEMPSWWSDLYTLAALAPLWLIAGLIIRRLGREIKKVDKSAE